MSRRFHLASGSLLQRNSQLQTAAKSRNASKTTTKTTSKIATAKPSASAQSSTSRITPTNVSDKIRVIPFNHAPKTALVEAMARSASFIMDARYSSTRFMYIRLAWAFIRTFLGLKSKLFFPKVKQWRAVYLPVWKYDSFASLKVRLAGLDYTMENPAFDVSLIGTHVEPLASLPLNLPNTESWVDLMESYSTQKHLNVFKAEDMPPDEPSARPIIIPFSSILPDAEEVFSKTANAYREEDVRFTGEVSIVKQAAYPFFMPFYLVDLVDANPAYPDLKATAVMWGNKDIEMKSRPFAMHTEGHWHAYGPGTFEMDIRLIPKITTPKPLGYPRSEEESSSSNGPYSTNPFQAARAAAELGHVDGPDGQPLFAEAWLNGQKAAMIGKQAARDLIPRFFVNLTKEAEKLDPNVSLVGMSKKLDAIDWIMPFDTTYEHNRAFITACADKSEAEFMLSRAKALPVPPVEPTSRGLMIERGGIFGFSVKVKTAGELAEIRKKAIAKAQEKLNLAQAQLDELAREK